MKRILQVIFILLLFLSFKAYAQDRTITGRVTSSENNEALPGVTVAVKNTTIGTVTDIEGKYTLLVPANAETLSFSYVGMTTSEVPIGTKTVINASMAPNVKQLNEVVVTALGLEANRDRLGTASSSVKGPALVQSGETNAITGISGKAPGVNITRNSGDPGAGAYILLRGQSTITGNTQPLIVVDGVPISNSTYNSDPTNLSGSVEGVTGVGEQSRLSDINPDDIANIEVLKSASAAALWGTRAANGVIMITTKKGKNSEGKINISFRSSLSLDEINKSVPLQKAFGQGIDGYFVDDQRASWGDKIADRAGGQDVYVTAPGQYFGALDADGLPDPSTDLYNGFVTFPDGTQRYVIPAGGSFGADGIQLDTHGGKRSKQVYDHSKDVFRTGYFWDNNLSVSGGNQNSNYLVSIGNLEQKGVIRNNSDYKRTTVHMSINNAMNKWITVKLNANYSKNSSNRIQKGSNLSGLFLGGLRTPADFNSKDYYIGNYTDASGATFVNRQVANRNPIGANVNSIYDNPFWSIRNNRSRTNVNRFFGNIELVITPLKWLEIISRQGIDYSNDRRTDLFNTLSSEHQGGLYREQTIQENQFNSDIIGKASYSINSNLKGYWLVGFNLNDRRFNQVGGSITSFVLPNAPPNLGNAPADQKSPFNNLSVIRTGALYSELSIEAFDQLFVNLTGRGETASTFGPDAKNTFYYPSATIAWQFTKLNALARNRVISFGKLRASAGIVGRQPDPYTNNTTYSSAAYTESWGGALDAANYGGGYGHTTYEGYAISGNPSIKPERKQEIEAGADLRFWQDRLSISGTYYYNKTSDAIFPANVTPSSGFYFQWKNAAKLENKGVELEINAEWLRIGKFSWITSANWFRNRNKVLELEGTTALSLGGFTDPASFAIKGQPLGTLYGTAYLRGEDGKMILDDLGFPQVAPENKVLGNPNPDWRSGIGNTFRYGRLSLYILFDHLQGGDIYNGTRGALYTMGTHKDVGVETVAPVNLNTWDGQVINQGTTFRGTVKDFGAGPVALNEVFYTQGTGGGLAGAPAEAFIEKQTNTRLRELTIGYSLATSGFRKFTGLQSAEVSVTGRNLALWTNYNGIDPETNLLGAINARGIDYFNNPNTRSIVFTLRINY